MPGGPLLPGIRPVAGDAATLMAKRLPKLPKAQVLDQLMAVDPLKVVLAGYGGRAEEALARASLFQQKEPLQYLTEGRFYDNRAAGVTGHELPLLGYPGAVLPGTRNAEGLFRLVPRHPHASIQVAYGSSSPRDVLLEESRHAIDRQLLPGEKSLAAFRAPHSFAGLLGSVPYEDAQSYMSYYARPAEVRATLSGLLAESPEFINTRAQAEELLERAAQGGTMREQATAEGLMNSRQLRNSYIPYLLKALSAGGVLAGNSNQE